MNQSVLKTLEYPKIISMLRDMATSAMGKEMAEKLLPSNDFDEVSERISQTDRSM